MAPCRDLTLELPFTLTHPKPAQPVVSQMVTLPYKHWAKKKEGGDGEVEGGSVEAAGEKATAADEATNAHMKLEDEEGGTQFNLILVFIFPVSSGAWFPVVAALSFAAESEGILGWVGFHSGNS